MRQSVARKFDEYLAASARAGDRRAFERLAKHWQPRLIAHAYRMTGDRELALEIVQESWIDIYKGLSSLKDVVVFPAWAFRITTRRAVDAIRKIQRQRAGHAAMAAQPEPVDQSPSSMEMQAERTSLIQALSDLSPNHQVVIALHYAEGFSVAEISAAIEVPAGTVKTRLMHARRNLRETLEGKTGNEPTG